MSERAEEAAVYAEKVRKAAQLLLAQTHKKPGVKGWELRRSLGRDYMKVIELLEVELDKLGFKVKILPEEAGTSTSLSEEQLMKARFLVVPKEPIRHLKGAIAGWRIDEVAMLAATVAYITSRHGKAPRRDVEALLAEKFPRWMVELGLRRFIGMGYLAEKEDMLYLDWRTRAEIDQRALLSIIIGKEVSSKEAGR